MLDDEDDAALVEAAKQAELQAASATADPINMTTEPFIQARANLNSWLCKHYNNRYFQSSDQDLHIW